ncbi:polysaccharide biosynthesis protein [Rhodocaloribacter sp.]
MPADTAILYLAFVGALKIRLSTWHFLLHETNWGPALLLTIGVYLIALILSGIYRMRPRTMHLDAYLRVAASLLIGWAASLTLVYLVAPTQMPPRSVTAAHLMFSITGVLGLRAVLRYVYERERPDVSALLPPRKHSFEDLLERPPIEIDRAALGDYLSGRTVLVTGAGGSVGSELAQQLITLRPFRLVLVDVSEYNLFQLENTLRKLPFEGDLQFRIADVRDEPMMRTLFSALRPDVVFHAAAYKHVPLMERHPIEAFRNNTMTTVALMRLCEAYDTEQFVFISTDKAVAPSSVLGATKRLAEWYVRTVHAPMHCKTVRFGNVLGSQGSVAPTFAEQIAAGGPVTITHPEMDRFFMTAGEACCLILETLLLEDAPIYALQMGEPVRIVELARRMIARLNPWPGRDIEIAYTGIRPGEKLHERLIGETETPVETPHERIIGLRSPAPFSRSELDAYFAYLQRLCDQNRTEELRKALFQDVLQPVEPHEIRS